jgi:hypothetical protein
MIDNRVQAPRDEGIGLDIPERKSDCTGSNPSWRTFVINDPTCDHDGPDPAEFTERQLTIPD